ncbi:uncharacterized protein LODBEIA_P19130 [Lodderomyces beijingensis]|uniref:Sulfite efflux pump SSU1 n=1 Tax=Lodderomyces beijingensis TaxID=1775926 RepID=A0ABP0ZHQ0_9ASCO
MPTAGDAAASAANFRPNDVSSSSSSRQGINGQTSPSSTSISYNHNHSHLDSHQRTAPGASPFAKHVGPQAHDAHPAVAATYQDLDPASTPFSATFSQAHHQEEEEEAEEGEAQEGMDYDSALNSVVSAPIKGISDSDDGSGDTFAKTKATTVSFYERFFVGDLVKNFAPAYFVSVMGTGISSSLLHHFPFPARWLTYVSYIMFAVCCLLFLFNVVLFVASCWYFPGRWRSYHVDPLQASYMGCFSMGYITIVNYITILVKGHHMYLVWTLWWIAVFSAVYTSFLIVYLAFFSKLNKMEFDAKLNATLLLPIVSITVVSSSGHMLELDLYHQNEVIVTMVVSFMLWCLSISLAFMIMTLYVGRLIMHKIPPTNLIFTSFLPVGFLGQSSYSIYLFGNNLNKYVPEELLYGKILLCIGGFFGVFLLALGYFMTFIAVASIFSKIKPFAKTPNANHTNKLGLLKHNKGFWAMTFPLGTMSLGNSEVGLGGVGNHPLLAFKWMSAIFAVACILVTTACLVGCVIYAVGKIHQEVRFYWGNRGKRGSVANKAELA